MGGNRPYLEKVARLYNYVLNKSLEMGNALLLSPDRALMTPLTLLVPGCLGTEETLLTMAYYRRPDLFHVHHNVEDRSNPAPDSDDVCYFVWPGEPAQVLALPTQIPVHRLMAHPTNLWTQGRARDATRTIRTHPASRTILVKLSLDMMTMRRGGDQVLVLSRWSALGVQYILFRSSGPRR